MYLYSRFNDQISVEGNSPKSKILDFLKYVKSQSETLFKSDSIIVKVNLFTEIKTKKWLAWSNTKNFIEQWVIPINLSHESEIQEKEVRERTKQYLQEISKECLKSFEHFSEGMPDSYEFEVTLGKHQS